MEEVATTQKPFFSARLPHGTAVAQKTAELRPQYRL
jgi:hypothetical protein